MLESFLVLTRTGLLLWATQPPPPPAILDAVSALIREQVLPERGGSGAPFPAGSFTLRCAQHSDQLLFVAVSSTQLLAHSAYAEPLLGLVRERWVALYGGQARSAGAGLVAQGWEAGCEERAGWSALAAGAAPFAAGFEAAYQDLREAAECAEEERGRKGTAAAGKTPAAAAKGAPSSPSTPLPSAAAAAAAASTSAAAAADAGAASPQPGARGLTPIEKARLAAAGKKPASGKGAPPAPAQRTWDEDFKYSAKAASALDCSKKTPLGSSSGEGGGGSSSSSEAPIVEFSAESRAMAGADLQPAAAGTPAAPAVLTWLSRAATWVATATGARLTLTAEHLAPVCQQLKTTLIERNVSEGVAEVVVRGVAARLLGQVLEGGGAASRLAAHVTDAMRDTLERILCPTEPVDLLRDVAAHREANAPLPLAQRSPYVVVFCGVNGVGKSTTLAKVAFMLREGGARVLIAACDSFRSGAVEQLKKHCRALGVELYEQGYQKEPAEIARSGIRRARECGADCVLVDTAGRMQNNVQLMKQLAKLVGLNKPHKVLFVGEALVGGDGVDQLREFHKALVDHGEAGAGAQGIDGIVLTKFDTVDDKVGAALSMVHETNIPIAYLGVGQTYTDIRRLNVAAVLASLLAQ